jgi:plasmid stability protein
MAQILVRNLDKKIVESLKKQAREDGRSLQSEVKFILEKAALEPKVDMERVRKIFEEFRKRFKGRKFSDSVDLIREDRNR